MKRYIVFIFVALFTISLQAAQKDKIQDTDSLGRKIKNVS